MLDKRASRRQCKHLRDKTLSTEKLLEKCCECREMIGNECENCANNRADHCNDIVMALVALTLLRRTRLILCLLGGIIGFLLETLITRIFF